MVASFAKRHGLNDGQLHRWIRDPRFGDEPENGGSAIAGSELNAENTGVVCFVEGTLIRTSRGDVPVETLNVGDMLLTATGSYEPIIWRDHTTISKAQQESDPNLRPVRIKPGSMGNEDALFVSQQHCMAVDIDGNSYLVRAKHLAEYTSVAHISKAKQNLVYHHILLPEHAVIYANGAASESFYPGPQSVEILAAIGLDALAKAIAPHASQSLQDAYGPRRLSCLLRHEVQKHIDLLQFNATPKIAPQSPLGFGASIRPVEF